MADETLKYKIELDDSDLATQLQSIRGQIDAVLGNAYSQQSAAPGFQMYTPGTSPFETPMAVPMTPNFTSQLQPGMFSNFNNILSNVSLGGTQALGDLGTFSANARMAASLAANSFADTSSPFLGAMGFGYDPQSPYSFTDYQAANSSTIGANVKSFTTSVLDATPGIGVGLALGAINPILGILGGFATDAIYDAAVAKPRAYEAFGEGLAEISRANLGYADDRSIGGILGTTGRFMKSDAAIAGGMDITQAGNLILEYASAGGYTGITSTSELETRTQNVLENISKVSKILGMFQDEAARMLGDLESKGISVGNYAAFAGGMGALSSSVGLGKGDLISQGVATVDMLGSTDMSPTNAFNLGVDARYRMANLLQSSDPLIRSSIMQQGGSANAANATIQQGISAMMGPLGTLTTAAMAGGSSIAADPASLMQGASSFYSNPVNYFTQLAEQGLAVDQILSGPNASLNASILGFSYAYNQLGYMGLLGEDGSVDTSQLIGAYVSAAPKLGFGNVSVAQARSQFAAIRNYAAIGEGGLSRRAGIQEGGAVVAQYMPEEIGFFTGVGAKIGRGLSTTFELGAFTLGIPQFGYGVESAGSWAGDAAENLIDGLYDHARIRKEVLGNIKSSRIINAMGSWGANEYSDEVSKAFGNYDLYTTLDSKLLARTTTAQADRYFSERSLLKGRYTDGEIEQMYNQMSDLTAQTSGWDNVDTKLLSIGSELISTLGKLGPQKGIDPFMDSVVAEFNNAGAGLSEKFSSLTPSQKSAILKTVGMLPNQTAAIQSGVTSSGVKTVKGMYSDEGLLAASKDLSSMIYSTVASIADNYDSSMDPIFSEIRSKVAGAFQDGNIKTFDVTDELARARKNNDTNRIAIYSILQERLRSNAGLNGVGSQDTQLVAYQALRGRQQIKAALDKEGISVSDFEGYSDYLTTSAVSKIIAGDDAIFDVDGLSDLYSNLRKGFGQVGTNLQQSATQYELLAKSVMLSGSAKDREMFLKNVGQEAYNKSSELLFNDKEANAATVRTEVNTREMVAMMRALYQDNLKAFGIYNPNSGKFEKK